MDSHLSDVALVALQCLMYAASWLLGGLWIREHRREFLYWAGFLVMLGSGFLLLTFRGEPRTWWAYNGSALAWFASLLLLWRGLEHFVRLQPSNRLQLASMAVALALTLWVGPSQERAAWRTVLSYGSNLVAVALALVSVAPAVRRIYGTRLLLLLASPAVLLIAVFAGQVGLQLADLQQARELHLSASGRGRLLEVFLVAAGLFNLCFVALVAHTLVTSLRRQGEQDALTGLPNRRALERQLARLWHDWIERRQPFGIAIVDVDHFKSVNDSRGHPAGDAVLVAVGDTLVRNLRPGDFVGRYGGEEFVVASTGGPDDLRTLADRLRVRIRGSPVSWLDGSIGVTVSIGVARVGPSDSGVDTVLTRADEALYAAKAAGRDRVEIR